MSDIAWSVVSDTKDHVIHRGSAPYGDWTLSLIKHTRSSLHQEVRLSFHAQHPDHSRTELMTLYQAAEKAGMSDDDLQRNFRRYWWSNEIGRFQSWFEAQIMIELLHRGDADLPPFEQMLAESDFEPDWNHENQRGQIIFHRHKKKSALHFDTVSGERMFSVHLDNNNGWYNLGSLTMGDGSSDAIYPPQVQDHYRIGLKWIQLIYDLRTRRGGLLRKPLSGTEEFLMESTNAV